jgi:hypothetical protein
MYLQGSSGLFCGPLQTEKIILNPQTLNFNEGVLALQPNVQM